MIKHLQELYRFRDLLLSLAMRDIKVRYRQTFLGVAWAIMQPLAFMLIFTLVFSKFGKVGSDGSPYPIFSYTGLVPWTFFATGLSIAVNSVATNMNLVKKIYFPREVFPIGAVMGAFMDFSVASLLVAGLMGIYRMAPNVNFIWLPLLIALEVGFILAIALFASALNVFYRDIKYIVPLLVQLGMFVTPVIYSTSMVPERWKPLYMMNPMAVVIDGVRNIVLHGQPPDLTALAISMAVVSALCLAAYQFFKRVEIQFADAI